MEGHSSGLSGRHVPTWGPHRSQVEQDLGMGQEVSVLSVPKLRTHDGIDSGFLKSPVCCRLCEGAGRARVPLGWRLMLTSSPTWRCWVLRGLQVLQRPQLRKRFT